LAIANSLLFIVDCEDEGVLILPIPFPPTYFFSCLKNVCRNTGFEFINIFEVSSRVIIATPILALELFSLFFLVAFWYLFEERNSRLNQILINHYSENIRLKKELNALKEKSVNQ